MYIKLKWKKEKVLKNVHQIEVKERKGANIGWVQLILAFEKERETYRWKEGSSYCLLEISEIKFHQRISVNASVEDREYY